MSVVFTDIILSMVPTTLEIILIGLLIFLVSSISRWAGEKHLIKHHLPAIEESEVKRLRAENDRLTGEVKMLSDERDLYYCQLQGITHITRGIK